MKTGGYSVKVDGSAPHVAASLVAELRRAAIDADVRGAGRSVAIEARKNRMFSLDDVLEVVAEWLERNPADREVAHFTVTGPDRETSLSREIPARVAAAARRTWAYATAATPAAGLEPAIARTRVQRSGLNRRRKQ
jgi:hypothetical protein